MSDFDVVEDLDDLPEFDDDLDDALVGEDDDMVDPDLDEVDLVDADLADADLADLGLAGAEEDEDALVVDVQDGDDDATAGDTDLDDDEDEDDAVVTLATTDGVPDDGDEADEVTTPGGGEATALVEDADLLDQVGTTPLAIDRDLDVDDEVRDGEFVCRSCFMAKRESALADEDEMLCRDCV